MTSVPYYSGRLHNSGLSENEYSRPSSSEDVNNRDNDHHSDLDRFDNSTYQCLKSSISPDLLKIRHIRSILIKNVSEANNESLPQTSVDDLNDQSTKTLKKGKSSHNLKAHSDFGKSLNVGTTVSNSFKKSNYKPNQSNEIRRQLEFQKVNAKTFFECFYTINDFLNLENPYFISRIFPSHVELSEDLDLKISSKSATINLFLKHESQNWELLKQYHLKLSLLINLGDDLSLILHHLYNIQNLLLLKMSDDCYYILPNNNISKDTINFLKLNDLKKSQVKLETFQYKENSCTFDQIMTMNNYSRCNHDLLFTKYELSNRIADSLNEEDEYHKLIDQKSQLLASIKNLAGLIDYKIQHNYQLKEKVSKLEKLKTQKEERKKKLKYSSKSTNNSINVAEETESIQIQNSKLLNLINLEKSRISIIIQFVFPIKQVDNKYDFSLFNTCYPSSLIPKHRSKSLDFEHNSIIPISIISSTIIQKLTQISRPNSERLNSMIGYISLIVMTISHIFNIPLRYPIRFLGSNSYINDPISTNINMNNNNDALNANNQKLQKLPSLSNLKESSIYPLFICQNATLAVKFTYGLFLLRKNLEQLYDFENIVKIEEFNLLIACKIWLTCIEGYADLSNDDEYEDAINGSLEGLTDTELETFIVDNKNGDHDEGEIDDNDDDDDEDDGDDDGDKLSPLLNESLFKFKNSGKHNASIASKRSNVSGISSVSTESNANLVVNEFNHKLISEERIKHIKKHLLKGSK